MRTKQIRHGIIPYFIAIIYLFIYLFIIADLQCSVSFLLYSMVTQLHMQVYNLFSHIIMLHHT